MSPIATYKDTYDKKVIKSRHMDLYLKERVECLEGIRTAMLNSLRIALFLTPDIKDNKEARDYIHKVISAAEEDDKK